MSDNGQFESVMELTRSHTQRRLTASAYPLTNPPDSAELLFN